MVAVYARKSWCRASVDGPDDRGPNGVTLFEVVSAIALVAAEPGVRPHPRRARLKKLPNTVIQMIEAVSDNRSE